MEESQDDPKRIILVKAIITKEDGQRREEVCFETDTETRLSHKLQNPESLKLEGMGGSVLAFGRHCMWTCACMWL